MKSVAPILVAALIIGTAASSNAGSPRSFFNQVVKSAGAKVNSAPPVRQVNQFKNFGGGRHIPGGPGYVLPPSPPTYPGPGCGGPICPPPPPVCHLYVVYYYDCHYGWKTYGTFNYSNRNYHSM